jgi:hypothetical protein
MMKLIIDVSQWARLPELVGYADARGIGLADAVIELVNHGLSHLGDLL